VSSFDSASLAQGDMSLLCAHCRSCCQNPITMIRKQVKDFFHSIFQQNLYFSTNPSDSD